MDSRLLQASQKPTLRWILRGFDQLIEEKVAEIQKTWNPRIRTFFRDRMGFSLRRSSLTVEFTLDDQGRFIEAIEESYPDLNFAELVALKKFSKSAAEAEPYFSDSAASANLESSVRYVQKRLDDYDVGKIVEDLFELYTRRPESDVFGSYRLAKNVIQIYVVPCIIFGMVIEEDFMDMATTTLAHELAHGLHHVGEDKDGETWESFGKAEPNLIESLAEYYAREFARHASGVNPALIRTFNKTSEHLSPTYRRYEEWEDRYGYEIVYQALVTARRSHIVEFDEFTDILENTRNRLGGRVGGESSTRSIFTL